MDKLEEELYYDVGFWLHEFAWHKSYQINPSVALHSFFEAFKEHNFNVKLDDECSLASFSLDYNGKILTTSLSYEKILTGWKHQTFSSPNALYDSICIVYDNMKPTEKNFNNKNIEKKNQWSYYRNSETKKVRQKMEDLWMPYFNDYQENMFVSVDGEIPKLNSPKIFEKVLKKFPISIYKNASRNYLFSEGANCGPTEETLLELDFTEDLNPEDYYPSKFTMKEFFLGNYLNELSDEKNYSLKYKTDDKLKSLMICKDDILELGYLIKWKFKSLNSEKNN